MTKYNMLKKSTTLLALSLASCLEAQSLGIIGGSSNAATNAPYAAFVPTNSTTVSPITLPVSFVGEIESASINNSGQAILGGNAPGGPTGYVFTVSPGGVATQVLTLAGGSISGAVINASGLGLVGGQSTGGPAYAAFVSSSGAVSPLTLGVAMGQINAVALNSANQGLIGGENLATTAAYAAFVTPSGTVSPLNMSTASPPLTNAAVLDAGVAINSSGLGLIGGLDNATGGPFAAFVSPSSSTVNRLSLGIATGEIDSVAINDSGMGLVGGENSGTSSALVAIVFPSGVVNVLSDPSFSGADINDVALNNAGQGIVVGSGTAGGYGALVSPSGAITPLNLVGLGSPAELFSTSINKFGQALVGGKNETVPTPYAALVSPSGQVIPLNLGLSAGEIVGVSINDLSEIPLVCGSNSNRLANYINNNAPQNVFYLIPGMFAGTVCNDLKKIDPTTNAIPAYTADMNLFYIMEGLNNHLHDTRSICCVPCCPEDDSVPSRGFFGKKKETKYCRFEPRDNNIWVEFVGALAYRKPQHQTPGFNPSTVGGIIAYDHTTGDNSKVGVGFDYLYTQLHIKDGMGYGHVNQEDLFVYGTWGDKFYVDAALLGGFFQVSQQREMDITGFDFKARSKSHGWQLMPHLELGYFYDMNNDIKLTLNPFIMIDWANSWQKGFKEHGSSPFNFGQKSQYGSLLRSEVSLRLYETFCYDSWRLIVQERIGYANVKPFRLGKFRTFLVGSPGSFEINTLTSPLNLGVVELGLTFAPNRHTSAPATTIFYQGEFGSAYQSHQLGVELDWNF